MDKPAFASMLRVFATACVVMMFYIWASSPTSPENKFDGPFALIVIVPMVIVIIALIDGYLSGVNGWWFIIPGATILLPGLVNIGIFGIYLGLALLYGVVGLIGNGFGSVFRNSDERKK